MKIGQILRYPNLITTTALVDGFSNWYYETASPTDKVWNAVKLDSGINSSAVLNGSKQGVPYIAIRSSPHRFGSSTTPWEDIHRPDQGYSRYYGYNKAGEKSANKSLGNIRMLGAFIQHSGTRTDRLMAPPIIVLEAVQYKGRVKGQLIFHGVGVITKAELIVQRDPASMLTFPNYVFDIALLDLSNENEQLS